MRHLEEHIIENYLLKHEHLRRDDREVIEEHLSTCALCREHLEALQLMFASMERSLKDPPTQRDRELAMRLASKKRSLLPGYGLSIRPGGDRVVKAMGEIVEPSRRQLMTRVIGSLHRHPVRSAGLVLGFAAIFLGLFFFFRSPGDANISYARAKNEFLIAYARDGKEVWRKHIGPGYDWNDIQRTYGNLFDSPDQMIATADVDGDGKNEVICLFASEGARRETNAIRCFNSNGSERWRYELHRTMTFGQESFTDDYFIHYMLVDDFCNTGKVEIAAIAVHAMVYPSVIILLDANNGTLKSEYWHSGDFFKLLAVDLHHDGIKEIIAGAENNAFNVVGITVLDPRFVMGHAPATPAYTPVGTPEGLEMEYCTVPRTDLSIFASHKRNVISGSYLNSDGFEFIVGELVDNTKYSLIFYFDSLMRCTRVANTDEFVVFHNKMEAEGKVSQKLDTQYYEKLRMGVQYWDGEKFVGAPTMNKKYLEHQEKP